MISASVVILIKILFILILGTGSLIIIQKTLSAMFSLYSLQSLLITVIAVVLFIQTGSGVLMALAAISFVTKVILIPFMLNKVRKESNLKRDGSFRYLTPVTSILAGIALIFIVYGSFNNVFNLSRGSLFFLGAVIGVSLALHGMLVIFSRKKVISKIVGYLMMENGILIFSLFMAELPFIIELLILVDLIIFILLAAVLAFGIESTEEDFQRKLNDFSNWFKR
jgi:hydrogenase-4 component E